MKSLRNSARPWLMIAVLAVLVMRLGDVHLHLCFDGQEAPATLHAVHADEIAHHADEEHSDADVNVFGAILVKKGGVVDLPLLAVACFLLFLLRPPRGQRPSAAFEHLFPFRPPRLLPPLRGPPL
jgi:hypothetical protein